MILLDTNVVSDLMKDTPDPVVLAIRNVSDFDCLPDLRFFNPWGYHETP